MSESSLDQPTIESLLESVGGDREFLAELFATFIDEAPGLLQSVDEALARDDFDRLRHAAHTLKSTSASLGALKLSELSRQFEEAGRMGEKLPQDRMDLLRSLVEQALRDMSEVTEGV